MRAPLPKPGWRRGAAIGALAFAPKCLLCALAYAGLFGAGGVEFCGATPSVWPETLPAAAGGLAVIAYFWANRRRRSPVSLS